MGCWAIYNKRFFDILRTTVVRILAEFSLLKCALKSLGTVMMKCNEIHFKSLLK